MDVPNSLPLTMSGIVQLKVNTQNGPINPGDPLTSSNIAGAPLKPSMQVKLPLKP